MVGGRYAARLVKIKLEPEYSNANLLEKTWTISTRKKEKNKKCLSKNIPTTKYVIGANPMESRYLIICPTVQLSD